MSVFVVRAFVKTRGVLSDSAALAKKLASLEAELKSRLAVHDVAMVELLQRLMDILDPPPQPDLPRREIGFQVTPGDEPGGKPRRKARK